LQRNKPPLLIRRCCPDEVGVGILEFDDSARYGRSVGVLNGALNSAGRDLCLSCHSRGKQEGDEQTNTYSFGPSGKGTKQGVAHDLLL
jgi:hypothetical protein